MLHAISEGYTLVHKIGGRKRKANKKRQTRGSLSSFMLLYVEDNQSLSIMGMRSMRSSSASTCSAGTSTPAREGSDTSMTTS